MKYEEKNKSVHHDQEQVQFHYNEKCTKTCTNITAYANIFIQYFKKTLRDSSETEVRKVQCRTYYINRSVCLI